MSDRVVLIGLDAFDPTLGRALAAQGRLPAIAELLRTAAVAELRSPEGFFVSTIWPTLSTSRRVTAFHSWDEIEAGTYERRLTSPASVPGTPFWRSLARAGRTTAVLDVPHTRIPADAPAVEIAEWGCHDRHFGLRSSPPALAADLERRFGLHPVLGTDAHIERQFAPDDFYARDGDRRTLEEERQLTAGLLAGAQTKNRISLELLGGQPDLLVSVFGESHAVGHQLWHLHNPAHPEHDPARAQALGDPVADVYAELDRAVAEHLAAIDPDATFLLLLSHGMAEHFDATHMLHEVLRRLDSRDRGQPPVAQSGPLERAYAKLPRRGRRRARGAIAAALRRREVGIWEDFGVEDRAAQRFFATPNNTVFGGIRINLAGREPNGIVEPGEELDRVCEQLAADLAELINVDTGEPVVEASVRTGERYRREAVDSLPDLWVDWNRSAPIERVWSPKVGFVHAPYLLWRTGDHRPGGLLLARGPGIAPGPRPPVDSVDLGPTIASRLGVELEDVDGEPVAWLATAGART